MVAYVDEEDILSPYAEVNAAKFATVPASVGTPEISNEEAFVNVTFEREEEIEVIPAYIVEMLPIDKFVIVLAMFTVEVEMVIPGTSDMPCVETEKLVSEEVSANAWVMFNP